jgi:hypothetical protein
MIASASVTVLLLALSALRLALVSTGIPCLSNWRTPPPFDFLLFFGTLAATVVSGSILSTVGVSPGMPAAPIHQPMHTPVTVAPRLHLDLAPPPPPHHTLHHHDIASYLL